MAKVEEVEQVELREELIARRVEQINSHIERRVGEARAGNKDHADVSIGTEKAPFLTITEFDELVRRSQVVANDQKTIPVKLKLSMVCLDADGKKIVKTVMVDNSELWTRPTVEMAAVATKANIAALVDPEAMAMSAWNDDPTDSPVPVPTEDVPAKPIATTASGTQKPLPPAQRKPNDIGDSGEKAGDLLKQHERHKQLLARQARAEGEKPKPSFLGRLFKRG